MDPVLQTYLGGGDIASAIRGRARICDDLQSKKLAIGTQLGKGTYGTVSLLVENQRPNSLETLISTSISDIVVKIAFNVKDVKCEKNRKGEWCNNTLVSEWIIGIYLSNEYVKGIELSDLSTQRCIHFTRMFDISDCTLQIPYKQQMLQERAFYITMERIDIDIEKLIKKKCLEDRYIESVIFQILFSMAYYQEVEHLRMSHNDLKLDNIFATIIKDGMRYGGKNLIDVSLFSYSIADQLYAIAACPVICKIGDFGFSTLWNKRPIGYQDDIYGIEELPGKLIKAYDLIFFIAMAESSFYDNSLVKDIIDWIFKGDDITDYLYNQYDDYSFRPIPSKIDNPRFKEKTAFNLLQSDVFKDYRVRASDRDAVLEDGVVFGVL